MKLAYIDLEQAESRVVGAIVFHLFGESNYLDACESSDLHTLVCSMCWTDLPWPADFSLEAVQKHGTLPDDLVAAAKKIAKGIAYRDMSYRDLAKRLGHGSNYRGQPPQMAKHTHIAVKFVQNFQRTYFEAFPGIPRWHRWVAEQVQVEKQITTLLGRRRFFFGRPGDDSMIREAVAYEPQSVGTGDYLNYGLYNLWAENLPIKIFAQVHDAVAFSYDEQDEDWILSRACAILETEFDIESPNGDKRKFSIPTEALIGWNLSYKKPNNPDGLIVWTGEDDRTRQIPLKRKILDFNFGETKT